MKPIKHYICLIVFYFLVCCQISSCRKIPSFVNICKQSEPDINKCVTNTITSMRDELMKGIPQMGIRPLDPIKIPELYLEYGQGTNTAFEVQLADLAFEGVKDFQIKNINFNDVQSDKKEGVNLFMELFFPQMYLTADFDVNGKLLMLVFKSQGQFYGNFTSVTLNSSFVGRIVKRDGNNYFVITGSNLIVDIDKMYVYFKNLISGNEELSERMNEMINMNTDIIYDELKPIIQKTIKAVIADSLENVYKYYTIDQLFP